MLWDYTLSVIPTLRRLRQENLEFEDQTERQSQTVSRKKRKRTT
jgi:hypothetical protein